MRDLSGAASRSPRFWVTRCRLHQATMEGEGGGGVGAELGLEGRGVFMTSVEIQRHTAEEEK